MAAARTAATDEQLVALTRAGSDDALEGLFLRYKDRIASYVRGIVPDQGKAEDIVQETFISALRSLRSTRQPIAFRPWIYQIARNACIDQLRRQKRAQEVSIDSDAFNPQDEGRISQASPSTHGAVSQREDMHALRQAFGGLPASQHEALVLRELEGLSYTEIASRMNLSAAAVESMLFRARRGLKDEYDEIATGERCRRMQPLIAAVAEGLGGARDRQALARHVRFCVGCRREATAMGLGSFVMEALRRGRMKRALHRAAALFPIPPFLLRRRGASTPDASMLERLNARVQAPLSQLGVAAGPAAENAAGALPKAVAVVVAAALIGGGGFAGQKSGGASASAAGGGAAAFSTQGAFGQPSASPPLGGQAPSDPFGSMGGVVRSGDTSAAPTGASGQNGGVVGFGTPAAPGGALGLGGGGGQSGLDSILGGSVIGGGGSGSGSPSKPSLGGKLGDTVDGAVPQSVGGISLPRPGGSGSSPAGGGAPSVDRLLDQTVPNATDALPRLTTPSPPSQPRPPSVPPPAQPSIPQIQVPQTPPSLQQVDPLPNIQVPAVPPVSGLPLG
jgi:RNA polymerase sigma factor (sigma-70 family)